MPTIRRSWTGSIAAVVDVDAVEQDLALDPCAPGMTSCIRLSERRNVLLPQPDGPMMAVTACGWMSSVTSRTARKAP